MGVLLLFFFLLPLLSAVRFSGFGFWFLVFAKTCLFSWLTTQINWMENPKGRTYMLSNDNIARAGHPASQDRANSVAKGGCHVLRNCRHRGALDLHSARGAPLYPAPGFPCTGLRDHTFETLARLAGLRGTNKRDVKARLIKAHEEMKKVGFLVDFEATDAGIKIKKTNTPAQQKHLVKVFSKPERKRAKKGTA